ncbi:hypothetical protein BK727_12200 [Bacillus thuringiensis serovar roskildiensis]|uniref:Uncharacterized protein n=1 Tax=Bacillus thuringiensis serovar sooncheon TaxID=180891 RepID=A0A9Q5SHX1_BACTU|nr:hypothetical protein BK707_17390 [Bacillus thuringiensis serovar coreanensis]OTX42665.1 hypothetical protein BK724_25245 [Bacillus thuringiensis serovar sooncheon]OTX54447.1 hypothetical protein BK725_12140 [Bacillus thuringiensis serovar guiyangiensis]OTX69445.1 hypothetical protein BK727_12200 [Bacillus thuringiensis serovar roskildiensis]
MWISYRNFPFNRERTRGTAQIHVILSYRLTFISKHNRIGFFSMIFEPIIIHPNHTIETKCFQWLITGCLGLTHNRQIT